MTHVTVTPRPKDATKEPPDHWIGNPPTHFRNPWPSYRQKHSLREVLYHRFSSERNFVPLPEDRDELVGIQTPTWGDGNTSGIKATWIGHASFVLEMPAGPGCARGVRLLMDPVFSDRMGPRGLVGPRRFSSTPCRLEDVPPADVVCISHNHYDHLDIKTVQGLYHDARRASDAPAVHFFCGLNTKAWFVGNCGVRSEDVTEMDWWDEVEVAVPGAGALLLACTPSQHGSRRAVRDDNRMLWCSFVVEELLLESPKRFFFAGDTGYRTVTAHDVASGTDEQHLPRCPAFKQIGSKYGPFDLALLPIGCYSPRTYLSAVHCTPEDSVEVHLDIQSKRSLGMHYGTLRGSLSAHYEDVREPPARWKAACLEQGLRWGEEIFLCDIGETVIVE